MRETATGTLSARTFSSRVLSVTRCNNDTIMDGLIFDYFHQFGHPALSYPFSLVTSVLDKIGPDMAMAYEQVINASSPGNVSLSHSNRHSSS
jgi:hypothetical protein